jgi:hypothetical protein
LAKSIIKKLSTTRQEPVSQSRQSSTKNSAQNARHLRAIFRVVRKAREKMNTRDAQANLLLVLMEPLRSVLNRETF